MSSIKLDNPVNVHHDGAAAIHETHSAYVVLIGDHAYKAKKAVRTPFLDFLDVEARRVACEREFVLNARFAPDVYLGVSELTDPLAGPSEPVLTMRRLPENARLSTRAENGEDLKSVLDLVARRMAAVHSEGPTSSDIDRDGTRDALAARWASNISELRSMRCVAADPTVLDEIETRTHQYLAGRARLFDDRVRRHRIVDGHGDLLADDIFVLPDGPRILDCLDFDDSLRHLDGIDDICCLAMDLEYLGREDLAVHLLASYRASASDSAPQSLVHHYVSYRAFMRAKVACIRLAQGHEPSGADAVRHLALALRHARWATITLALVGGLPGSGKTTLATALARKTGATVLSSDVVRKEGTAPSAAGSHLVDVGLYSPAAVRDNYALLLRRARELLRQGRSVIIDASWSDAATRQCASELAAEVHAELSEFACTVPRATAIDRIAARIGGPSDATEEVYEALATRWSPWRTAVEIDTTAPASSAASRAHAHWNGLFEHRAESLMRT